MSKRITQKPLPMTNEQEIKYFTASLRRVLYLVKILDYNLDTLRDANQTPFFIKDGVKRIKNAVGAFMNDCMYKGAPGTWDKVKADLSGDELHDLSLLLDTVADVTNIGEIVEVLKEHKQVLITV